MNDDNDINRLERKYSINIPDDVKGYYAKSNGGPLKVPKLIEYGGYEFMCDRILGFGKGGWAIDRFIAENLSTRSIPAYLVPIANETEWNGKIVVVCNSGLSAHGSVYYWSYEEQYLAADYNDSALGSDCRWLFRVSKSFQGFIDNDIFEL